MTAANIYTQDNIDRAYECSAMYNDFKQYGKAAYFLSIAKLREGIFKFGTIENE